MTRKLTSVPSSDQAKARAAAYLRYSDEGQNPNSNRDQLVTIERVMPSINAALDPDQIYSDPASRAGAWKKREGWRRLVAAVSRRAFDILVVESISRIARHYWRGSGELEPFAKAGIKIYELTSGQLIDLNSPFGTMYISNMLQFAQGETQNRSVSVRRGQEGAAKEGRHTGGWAPLGFRVEGARKAKHLVPDADTIAVALRIFELFDQGYTMHSIGRDPIVERAILARRKTGKKDRVRQSSIREILRNPIYGGNAIWGKRARVGDLSEVTGRRAGMRIHERSKIEAPPVPRIIPEDLWLRVQARLAAVAENAKGGRRKTARHLCSGLIRCVVCGKTFDTTVSGSSGARPVYVCSTRRARTALCTNMTRVPREALEAHVKLYVDTLVKDPRQLAALVEKKNVSIQVDNQAAHDRLAALKKEGTMLDRRKARLYKMLDNENLDQDDVEKELGEVQVRIKQLAAELADAEQSIAPTVRAIDVVQYQDGSASLWSGDPVTDRELLHSLVEVIRVYPDGNLVVSFKTEGLFRAHSIGFRKPAPDDLPTTTRGKRDRQQVNTRLQSRRHLGVVEHAYVTTTGGFVPMDPPEVPPDSLTTRDPYIGESGFLNSSLYGTVQKPAPQAVLLCRAEDLRGRPYKRKKATPAP